MMTLIFIPVLTLKVELPTLLTQCYSKLGLGEGPSYTLCCAFPDKKILLVKTTFESVFDLITV